MTKNPPNDMNQAIRFGVLFRDNYKCKECNRQFDVNNSLQQLHVHHVDLNKLNNDYSNLIALCVGCHRDLHKEIKKLSKKTKK